MSINNQYAFTLNTPAGPFQSKKFTVSTYLIIRAAEHLGISWRAIPNSEIIELKKGNITKHLKFQISPETTVSALEACDNKSLSQELFKENNVSVCNGYLITSHSTSDAIKEIFESLQLPIVVKPNAGRAGNNVFTNITNFSDFLSAVDKCLESESDEDPNSGVRVEEQFEGNEYRILASQEKIIAITNRVPAFVIGNGTNSIEDLIVQKNKNPLRGKNYESPLTTIEIDDDLIQTIETQGYSLESIPEINITVNLRAVSNISKGGESVDITDEVHPSVKKIALQAIRSIPNLAIAGIDFMTQDISSEQSKNSYRIIEINASAGISMHIMPAHGTARPAHFEFLKLSFPDIDIPQNWETIEQNTW